MKTFSKIVSLFLVLALFASLAFGCGSGAGEKKEIVNNSNQSSGGSGNSNSSHNSNASNSSNSKVDVTIDEQVLLTWNDLTVTATKYVTDSIMGDGIKVLIENNGTTDLNISCDALIVNNYMIADLFSADVAAGKKANETIYLSSTELETAGIDNVGQIEFYFDIYDSNSYETLYDAEGVMIKTSAYDRMDTVPNDFGAELYNENGIKIVGKFVEEDSYGDAAVLLFIENTSEENITVTCEDLSVNGYMISGFMYSTVYANKMAMDTINIYSSDLEENEITAVEEIELKFEIINSDTYDEIDVTDAITFSVK